MKKKIFMITLAACLVVLSIAGTSLAYFTDIDEKTDVVFTAGNVDIELTYEGTAEKVFPGKDYDQTATIKNVGSEEAYVAIVIEVVTDKFDAATIESIFTVDNNDTVKCVEIETGKYAIFAIVNDKLAADNTVDVVANVAIPAAWDHEQIGYFTNNLTVNVTAYATQTVGFDNGAVEAITTAFDTTVWANYPND